MDNIKPQSNQEYLSSEEAKEWMRLQAEICEMLTTKKITSATQLDPGLIETTRFHLATCEVKNHPPIDGLFIDPE